MKIVVLVKYVPESTAVWKFGPDLTLDRAGIEGHLSELDEYAVEQAVRLVEGGASAAVTVLSVGPAQAREALMKALAMGAGQAVHVIDDGIHGSDALGTSLVLAKALEKIGYDLVLTGMASTDAEMSAMPSMVAERLGANQATFAKTIALEGENVKTTRDGDTASLEVTTALPAVVSITDQSGEARYPAFRQIMMAKKKPFETLSLADLGIEPALVGAGAAAVQVRAIAPAPPRAAGTVITDDGTGAAQLADFLAARGLL